MASSSPTQVFTASHRRRRSSLRNTPTPAVHLQEPPSYGSPGASSGLPADGFTQPLPPIPGTPAAEMSLSRSPSPNRGGGWSSPGLTTPFDNVSGRSSPRKPFGGEFPFNANGGTSSGNVTWASAEARRDEVNRYPSFSTKNSGFFSRNARKLSQSLPTFNKGPRRSYAEKEKLGRGRYNESRMRRILSHIGMIIWRMRLRFVIVLGFLLAILLFYVTRTCPAKATSLLLTRFSSHASSI